MFVLSELSFCLFDVLGMGMVCVYIGCHSGNGGDVNVLMTGKVQVQPTKRRNGLRLLEPAEETTQLSYYYINLSKPTLVLIFSHALH